MLLDLNLPKKGGLEVLKTIRYSYEMDTRIIIVSARTEESDIITGLELGADNYLAKPFSPKVLMANVKALLRRGEEEKESTKEKEEILPSTRDFFIWTFSPIKHRTTKLLSP